MASSRSWTPSGEAISLRDAMNRLMEDAVLQAPRTTAEAGGHRPPFDLYETPDGFILRAWLPGVPPDRLDLTFEKGTLSLQAPMAEEPVPGQGVTWHRRELGRGRWVLSLGLPADLDPQRADATLEHGVLTLRLPKAETARPRTIQVRTGT